MKGNQAMWKKFTDELPPDRKQILISGFIDNKPESGRWVEAAWHDAWEFYASEELMDEDEPASYYEPSHWMPLPEPPTE
jgi:hypothetical protein